MQINLPYEVNKIISILEENGFEAYAVGGCVRDSVIGREANDWDITTSAKPMQVKELFKRTIDTGIEHGTVTVRMHGKSYEVTTYRIDGKYSDSRHPESVEYTASLKEDLLRRDFTVNAMAYNPNRGLIDVFGGMDDIQNRVIRCVGDAGQRFGEDALRMLRAIRFSAQLGFSIEGKTYHAIEELHQNIANISVERIRVELEKTICSEHPEKVEDICKTGLSSVFFPEWDACFGTEQNTAHHCYNVAEHTIKVMQSLPADRTLRLAGLFHDIGKPVTKKTDKKGVDHFVGHPNVGAKMTVDILRRLKYDNETVATVSRLVRYHDERPPATMRNARRLAARVGREYMDLLFELKRADIAGQSDYMQQEKYDGLAQLEECYKKICDENDALTIADLAINGSDVMACGIKKGPEIGRILKQLLTEVVDEPAQNEREYLLARVRDL